MQNFAWFFKKPSKDWIKIWLLSTVRVVTGVHCQHVPHVARQPIHTHMQNPFAPRYSCQGDISQTAFGTVPVSLHCQFWDTKQIVNQTPRFPSDSNRNALISSLLEQSESSKASQCRPGRLEECWAQEYSPHCHYPPYPHYPHISKKFLFRQQLNFFASSILHWIDAKLLWCG